MAQRQQIAAQQGRDRSREARLIAQGLSPQAASAQVGQLNAVQDYYGQVQQANQDALAADVRKHQLNLYGQDLADARRMQDRDSQRAYDLSAAQLKVQAAGQAKQSTAKPNAKAAKTADTTGLPIEEQPEQKSKPALSTRAQDSISSLTSNKKFKVNDPGSLAQASRHFEQAGLDPDEHAAALGQLYDADFSDPSVASGTITNIGDHARATAKQQGSWKDSYGAVERRVDQVVQDHIPALNVIARAANLTPEQVAEMVYPKGLQMGTYDPFLEDRRKALVDALSAQAAGGAENE